MSNDDGFLSRWSRRKAQVRSGEPLPEPLPAALAAPAATAVAALPASSAAKGPTEASGALLVPEPAAPEPSPLTMDDVAALTPQSDFKPFVARAVDPQVRNAAMKTLFSDPHFNVMDGLDIYIDDYSQPNPLPLELARKLTSAQFMKVFDAPEPAPEALPGLPPQPSPQALPGAEPAAAAQAPEAAPDPVSGDGPDDGLTDATVVSRPTSMPPTESSA